MYQFLLLTSLLFSSSLAQTCYYPNGTATSDYVPCSSDVEVSSCCAPGDECLTNGLCKCSTCGGDGNDYWRTACTDQSWQSDACPKYCYNETTSPTAADGTYFVTACSTDTWCCADLNLWEAGERYACCNDQLAVFNAGPAKWLSGPQLVTATFPASSSSTTSSTVSSSATSLSTASTSTSSTATSSPSASATNSSNSLSTGAEAGIGVGVAAGAIAAIAAVAVILCRRRAKNKKAKSGSEDPAWMNDENKRAYHRDHAQSPAPDYYQATQAQQASYMDQRPVHEMGGFGAINEMPSDRRPAAEMAAEDQKPVEMEGSVHKP